MDSRQFLYFYLFSFNFERFLEMLSDVNVSFFYIKNWGVKKMKGRESGSTEEVAGLRPVGARPTRPRFRHDFLFFIFFKNVFYKNIFLVS